MQVNRVQPNMSARNKSNITFAGVPKVLTTASDKLSDTVELGLEKVAKSKGIEKFIKKVTDAGKSGWLRQGCIIGVSTVLSSFYIIQTLTNKNIEEKNKKPLAINNAITWAIPTAGAIALDKPILKLFGKLGDAFEKANEGGKGKKYLDWAAKHYKDGDFAALKKGVARNAATGLCFAFMYRYITPVIATPLTKKITAKIQKRKEEKEMAQQPAVQKISVNPQEQLVKAGQLSRTKNAQAMSTFKSFLK